MEEKSQTIVIQNPEGNGLAVAGLVLGIIGVVFIFVPVLPYILGILALIFGGVGVKKPVKQGMAKASIVLGAIAVGLKLLGWLFIGALFSSLF